MCASEQAKTNSRANKSDPAQDKEQTEDWRLYPAERGRGVAGKLSSKLNVDKQGGWRRTRHNHRAQEKPLALSVAVM